MDTPVFTYDNAHRPSLIRDLDGSLLFCAGGTWDQEYDTDLRVWRSQEAGLTWKKIIHVGGVISSAPVTINRAANGTAFIAATLYEIVLHPTPNRFGRRYRKDSQGRSRGGGFSREKICLWPLNAQRTDLETAILVRDCSTSFGPAPSGNPWFADHPCGGTVQLSDGRWHCVLAYRICDGGEVLQGTRPVPQTGIYVEEVLSEGQPAPAWNF